MRHLFITTALVVLSACGGSNPGGGTGTLYVRAFAESDGSHDGSRIGVEVRQASSEGVLVTDASVLLRGEKSGEQSLPWQGFSWGDFKAGSYSRQGVVWDSGWRIEVRHPVHGSLDAFLEVPGITTISEPIAETTFRRADSRPLELRWKDSFGHRAETTTVDINRAKYAVTLTDDLGGHDVIADDLVASDNERVRVTRSNDIELAGGVAGSLFRATTEDQIDLKVE